MNKNIIIALIIIILTIISIILLLTIPVDKNNFKQNMKNNFHNITLNVWEFNASARGFYESLGYMTQRREMERVL